MSVTCDKICLLQAFRAFLTQRLSSSQSYQMFDTLIRKCYHALGIKNSRFLSNLPPELPNQFLEKAIVKIEFIQQK